jgi:hypothetical protein
VVGATRTPRTRALADTNEHTQPPKSTGESYPQMRWETTARQECCSLRATVETRVRDDAEPRLLQPRDAAEAGRAKDLPLFGRGNGRLPNRGPQLRGSRASAGRRCLQGRCF